MITPPPPPPPPNLPPPPPAVRPAIIAPAQTLAQLAALLVDTGLARVRIHSITLIAGRAPKVVIDRQDWDAIGFIVERLDVRQGYRVHSTMCGPIEVCTLLPNVAPPEAPATAPAEVTS